MPFKKKAQTSVEPVKLNKSDAAWNFSYTLPVAGVVAGVVRSENPSYLLLWEKGDYHPHLRTFFEHPDCCQQTYSGMSMDINRQNLIFLT